MSENAFTLRIDKNLKEDLQAIAKEETRSLNSLIVYVLKEYVKNYKSHN